MATRQVQQFNERDKIRVYGSEPDFDKFIVVSFPAALIPWESEGVMDLCLSPEVRAGIQVVEYLRHDVSLSAA
ncbi:MAG: hypothetical protein C0402_13740 [Thermodesulfovibrio sp.]|nr:hypothetical protein [Thermodesulfovibrio sp.]